MPKEPLLDEWDGRLAKELQINARQSSRQLGKKLGMPHTTVLRRINKLLSREVLRIVALPNPRTLGYRVWVSIGINTSHGWAHNVAHALLQYPACYNIWESLGRFDVIVGARFGSLEEMTGFVTLELAKVEGIVRTETSLLTRPHRYYYLFWSTEEKNAESEGRATQSAANLDMTVTSQCLLEGNARSYGHF